MAHWLECHSDHISHHLPPTLHSIECHWRKFNPLMHALQPALFISLIIQHFNNKYTGTSRVTQYLIYTNLTLCKLFHKADNKIFEL
jgi:hypothetical protein